MELGVCRSRVLCRPIKESPIPLEGLGNAVDGVSITVVIPTYRPGTYLHECLMALSNQTLPASSYSILVVLNGCKEPYMNQIESWFNEARTKGIAAKCIQIDTPGVSHARNVGLDHTYTPYVCFVDDDDIISHTFLAELLDRAQKDTVVASNVKLTDGYLNVTNQDFFLDKAFRNYNPLQKHSLFRQRKFLSTATGKLIPLGVIGNCRFDPAIELGEDSLFMFTISDKIKGVAITSADAIYYVRERPMSATRKHIAYKRRVMTCFMLLNRYVTLWVHKPFKYSFPFFLSRVLATVYKLFLRKYK